MTLAEPIKEVETVADMIELLMTANPQAKFTVPPGFVLIKMPDGEIRMDNGVD